MSMTATTRSQAGSPPQPATGVIEELYRSHGLGLVRFALLLLGDQATAEDVVQEAFLGLYRSWRPGREPDDVLAYLRTAVLNAARTALRGRARRQAAAATRGARAAVLPGPQREADLRHLGDQPGNRRFRHRSRARRARREAEGGAVSTIEDRLRNAYQSATQTVRPESLRPSVLPHDEPAPPAKGGRGRLGLSAFRGGLRRLAPLAAAAAVVVVAVAAVTVPRLFPAAPPAASPFGPVVGVMSSPSPFLVVVRPPDIQVVAAATGRIVAQLPPPGARTGWSQAAAGPGGRQFLLAATDQFNACRSLQFFTLTLSGTGTVQGLSAYSATMTGQMLGSNNWGPGALAASADGSTIAYVTTNCASSGASQEMITVIRHGTVRTWTSSAQANPTGDR